MKKKKIGNIEEEIDKRNYFLADTFPLEFVEKCTYQWGIILENTL